MRPAPIHEQPGAWAGRRLEGRVALITGGDSGIGRAIAYAYAREGADIMIVYLEEDKDARETAARVTGLGRRCELHRADLGDETACRDAVAATIRCYDKLDILVNNAAEQHPRESLLEIEESQLVATFRTNVFAFFSSPKRPCRTCGSAPEPPSSTPLRSRPIAAVRLCSITPRQRGR